MANWMGLCHGGILDVVLMCNEWGCQYGGRVLDGLVLDGCGSMGVGPRG